MRLQPDIETGRASEVLTKQQQLLRDPENGSCKLCATKRCTHAHRIHVQPPCHPRPRQHARHPAGRARRRPRGASSPQPCCGRPRARPADGGGVGRAAEADIWYSGGADCGSGGASLRLAQSGVTRPGPKFGDCSASRAAALPRFGLCRVRGGSRVSWHLRAEIRNWTSLHGCSWATD